MASVGGACQVVRTLQRAQAERSFGPARFRLPRSKQKREALAETIGRDGWHLMSCVYDEEAPEYLRQVPAVDTLRRVWIQQYVAEEMVTATAASNGVNRAVCHPRRR